MLPFRFRASRARGVGGADMDRTNGFAEATARSADGTNVSYRSIGTGPSLVVVPGMNRRALHYDRLARELSGSFTVHAVDRRGRGGSGPPRAGHSMRHEVEDVLAVMDDTHSSLLFGHSYGGAVALHVALARPPERLVLYEPAVFVGGNIATWQPEMLRAIAKGDLVTAEAILWHGGRFNVLCRLPLAVVKMFTRLYLAGSEGKENAALIKTFEPEGRVLMEIDASGERYARVAVPTLLLGGTGSSEFLLDALRRLVASLPDARVVVSPGLEHCAPDRYALGFNSQRKVARQIRAFLLPQRDTVALQPRHS